MLVALATWWRWVALDGTDVAVVLALNLLSVPIVLFALAAPRRPRTSSASRAGCGRARRSSSAGALLLIVGGMSVSTPTPT